MKPMNRAQPRTRRAQRSLGVARAALYVTLLGVVSCVLITRKVVAEVSERTLRLGDDLGEWSSLIGPSTRVTVNGQQLSLGSRTVALSIAQVLARFAARCAEDAGDPLARLALGSGPAHALSFEQELLAALLVPRRMTRDEGAAACLVGAGQGGVSGLAQRVQAFLRTRDLGAIGALRYVHVRRVENGSHVVAVWNRGPLRLDQMFPERGDAPGEDFALGARPADAVRMLSATAEGGEYGVNVYRSPRPSARVLAQYGHALEARGFVLQRADTRNAALRQLGRAYVKDGEALLVSAQAEHDGSLLSVVQLAAGDASAEARAARAWP